MKVKNMAYLKYFLTKKRTYFTVLFIAVGMQCFIDGHAISGILSLIIGILISYSNISYLLEDPADIVSEWVGIDEYIASQDRMKRAENKELEFLYAEPDIKTGIYRSSEGKYYTTTLKKCTCEDYKRRKLPCKHMYHLAKELGVIELHRKYK